MTDQFPQVPGYTIHNILGKGGMATVYLATEEALQRQVAIKVLQKNNDDEQFVARFIKEAHLIAAVTHPRVITIYSIERLADGAPCIVMEYLPGGDLHRFRGTVLPADYALDILQQITEGLVQVHKQGIIHRDIKPANVLFHTDGSLVLSDFGIAKEINADSDLTQTGTTIGSPAYCSPEQTQGNELTYASDLYSLGVVFVELLLGVNPYKGGSYAETAVNQLQMDIPQLPENLRQLQPLIDRLLAKPAEERISSSEALLQEIESLREVVKAPQDFRTFTESSISTGENTVLKTTASGKLESLLTVLRERFKLILAATFALVAIIGSTLWMLPSEEEREIARLLQQAEIRVAENKLSLPTQDSAVYFYRQVLKIDPDNKDAQEGVTELIQRYEELTRVSLEEKDFAQGFRYLKQGLKLDPGNETLLALKSEHRDNSNAVKRFFNRVLNSEGAAK